MSRSDLDALKASLQAREASLDADKVAEETQRSGSELGPEGISQTDL